MEVGIREAERAVDRPHGGRGRADGLVVLSAIPMQPRAPSACTRGTRAELLPENGEETGGGQNLGGTSFFPSYDFGFLFDVSATV